MTVNSDAAAGTTARVLVLLDESGSMAPHVGGTLEQLNGYLDSLARLPGTTLVTLATFEGNRGYALRFKDVPAQGTPRFVVPSLFMRPSLGQMRASWPEGGMTYAPHLGGGTPLFDSLAKLIVGTSDAAPALVAVLTDGEENQSREWTRNGIAELIKNREAKGWTFAFLMAGFDKMKAEAYTQSFGGQAGNTMSYNKGQEGPAGATIIAATLNWRSTGAVSNSSSQNLYSDAGLKKDLGEKAS